MATEIKVWQIEDGKPIPLETTMAEAGRTEPKDLERWIKHNPAILGQDILIVGEQVPTKSGPVDFLAVDRLGNVVIVELKRDRIPREAMVQAIDYASDIASWDLDKLNEVCLKQKGQTLDAYVNENFRDLDFEDISWNQTQRILLVGTYVEEPLQRMIEWLSGKYGVLINAVLFRYIRTKSEDELIARTVVVPEDLEMERSLRQQRKIQLSDEPGSYEEEELKALLKDYLLEPRATPRRIRNVLLPLCLESGTVERERIKEELVRQKEAEDEGKAGTIITTLSRELGIVRRDYLRQIIRYDKISSWEKENYRVEEPYRELVRTLLEELKSKEQPQPST